MGPFYNWLKETEVWMHGADYDMSLFQNAWETLPAMIWDTQTAARLLGFRQFGLAALVEHFHGITLSKSSQKADWARRPLSPTMVTYALNDVNYMLDMADKLTAALREKDAWAGLKKFADIPWNAPGNAIWQAIRTPGASRAAAN